MSAESKRIQIKVADLIVGLQANDGMVFWYLNLETGDIAPYLEGMNDQGEVDEDFDIDEFLADEKYRRIEGIDSRRSFRIMEDFVDALPEGRAKDKLIDSLSRPKPFRRFKDSLTYLGHVREEWFAYQNAAYRELAQRWLEVQDIDADLVD